jgi:hypothetical protein
MVCADLRKLVSGEARPCPSARQTTIASVGVSSPNFSFFPFVIAGQSRPKDDIASLVYARQSMPKLRLRILPPAFARCSSAWTTGSSPVVTSKRQWLGKTRAQNRAARTMMLTSKRFPDAVQRETVHRRSGIVSNAEFAKVPVQQRTISCCAAPGIHDLINAPHAPPNRNRRTGRIPRARRAANESCWPDGCDRHSQCRPRKTASAPAAF